MTVYQMYVLLTNAKLGGGGGVSFLYIYVQNTIIILYGYFAQNIAAIKLSKHLRKHKVILTVDSQVISENRKRNGHLHS